MNNKENYINKFTQTETVDIILPSGDVVQTEVTFYISWDTISAILKTREDLQDIKPKDILNDKPAQQ